MAYDTNGLRMVRSGIVNEFVLDSTDNLAAVTAADYVSDAAPTNLQPGKGMRVGDLVTHREVDAVVGGQQTPNAVTAVNDLFVSAISSAGAATLVARAN